MPQVRETSIEETERCNRLVRGWIIRYMIVRDGDSLEGGGRIHPAVDRSRLMSIYGHRSRPWGCAGSPGRGGCCYGYPVGRRALSRATLGFPLAICHAEPEPKRYARPRQTFQSLSGPGGDNERVHASGSAGEKEPGRHLLRWAGSARRGCIGGKSNLRADPSPMTTGVRL